MTIHHVLAGAALVLGAGAAVIKTPVMPAFGSIDVRALASMVEREEDHVTARELAAWIKDRKPGLHVIDVRTAHEFDEYHIPTAERVPLSDIVTTPFATTDTVVLYSDGGAHAAQGWVFLRARGYDHVYFLRGGLGEWIEQVLSPTQPDAVTKYFGGVRRNPGEPPPRKPKNAC